MHGYEYPPIIAAQQLIQTINAQQLRGVIILVQVANLQAFSSRSPYINPLDGKNLNRVFPGNKKGTITEKIANFIICTDSLFFEKTKIVENWVDGKKYTTNNNSIIDIRGVYSLNIDKKMQFDIEIKGELDKLKGTISTKNEKEKSYILTSATHSSRRGVNTMDEVTKTNR